jgi:hypothetical protein
MRPRGAARGLRTEELCMRLSLSLAVVAAGILLASCASKPKMQPSTPAPQPASPQRIAKIRQAYQQIHPNARVGVVKATLPSARFAAVGDIPVRDFADNDIVTFIDSDQNVLTTGVVINRSSDLLHVQYDPPQPGRREPRVGDLAVRFQ